MQRAYEAGLPDGVCFNTEVPYTRVPKDRRYAAVTFDFDAGLYVAAALYDTVFMNFDEEGQPVFVSDCECRMSSPASGNDA